VAIQIPEFGMGANGLDPGIPAFGTKVCRLQKYDFGSVFASIQFGKNCGFWFRFGFSKNQAIFSSTFGFYGFGIHLLDCEVRKAQTDRELHVFACPMVIQL